MLAGPLAGVVALVLLATGCGGNDSSQPVESESDVPIAEPANADDEPAVARLPTRRGPRPETTGAVPHTQIGVEPVPEVDEQLRRRAFALPDVHNRPTIISLPGARGLWLDVDLPLARPELILRGREFSHIHPDGSLHAPLPVDRALEAVQAGWAELHPWVDREEIPDGLVLLYTPQSLEELEVTLGLLVESYNLVTGRDVDAGSSS